MVVAVSLQAETGSGRGSDVFIRGDMCPDVGQMGGVRVSPSCIRGRDAGIPTGAGRRIPKVQPGPRLRFPTRARRVGRQPAPGPASGATSGFHSRGGCPGRTEEPPETGGGPGRTGGAGQAGARPARRPIAAGPPSPRGWGRRNVPRLRRRAGAGQRASALSLAAAAVRERTCLERRSRPAAPPPRRPAPAAARPGRAARPPPAMVSWIISRLVVLIFGTLYPAYYSYKAVKSKDIKEYVKWMMYWIIFALFTTAETFTDIFLCWFPFYYELKIAFVAWLLSPYTKGSSLLYRKFVHPTLSSKEKEIDDCLVQAKDRSYDALVHFGKRGLNVAATAAVMAASKGQGALSERLRSFSMQDLTTIRGDGAPAPSGPPPAGSGRAGKHGQPKMSRSASESAGSSGTA
uniref:Receptor accessory protein 1 n=2 Tax=Vespertilionidae TaxID=9431 RepID=A0A7J7U6H8_MYOMY|nr:receptor accessory protein 1 [Myotis myotis]